MSKGPLVIDAGTLLTPSAKFSPGRLIVRDGVVENVGTPQSISLPSKAERIDASPYIVTPGFIDPHIHGCGGVDVMNATYESLNAVSRIVARHGTTSFIPTTVSAPPEALTAAVERLGGLFTKTFQGATPLGIHLEGPFINSARRGTHRVHHILPPDAQLLNRWITASQESIRLITLAPELPGLDTVLETARKAGIQIAMGHSNASFEEAVAAVAHGVCYAVHTFNGMRELRHRDPGIAGAVLSDDRVFAEIIADGVHVHPSVVKVFARAKGKLRVLLATDAISAMDMPDGQYMLGDDPVNVINGICRDSDGQLAGSTLTQEVALKNFVEWTSMSLDDALRAVTLNPARALQLERKGSLAPGADADIAILDDNFRVMKTFVAGRLVFDRLAS